MTVPLAVTDPVLLDFAADIGADDPIAVEGTRTRWALGGPLDDGVRLVRAPGGLVEHVPEEMTVTVRAGTPVAELHAELAERGQRTALPERGGTVGGALAVGENSMHLLGRGRTRECALQIRYVSDDGAVVTGGGPTVKNVTGFDLPRLLVGSLGTLGLIGEATLRTNPIPELTRWVRADDVDPFAVPDLVLRPSAVLYDGGSTWVELEGYGAAVEAEHARLGTLGPFVEVEGPPPLPPHRWSLPAAALRSSVRFDDGDFVASIGVGTVWASKPQPERPLDPAVAELTRRLKHQFDPRRRLNPGRSVGGAG